MMKKLFIMLMLLISISSVSAITPWNLVLDEGNAHNTPIGDLYILEPQSAVQGESVIVSAILVMNKTGINANIWLEGAPSTYEVEAGDTTNGDSYFQQEWLVDITKYDTNLSLRIKTNDKQIFKYDFLVEAKKVINETIIEHRFVEVEKGSKDDVKQLLEKQGLKYSSLEFDKAIAQANEQVQISKELIIKEILFDDLTTKLSSSIIITLKPVELVTPMNIIEIIPKEVAQSVSKLSFSPKPQILEADPVIMWHIENLDEEAKFEYSVNGNTSVTGNTVLVAQTVNEESSATGSFPWRIVAPILIIPIIGIVIIYFARFEPKK